MNLNEYTKRVRKILSGGVKAGIWGDATYPNGTPVVLVASVHEFGVPSRNVPEKAWFRSTVELRKADWIKFMSQLAEEAINAMRPVEWAKLGEMMVLHIREGLEQAGLKSTGLLIESVRYEVTQ